MDRIQDLITYRDDIYTCNRTRCGFCREECPVYKVNRYETFSCRGKMLVARGLLEGVLEPSKEMAEMLERCLLCGYCQARCALKNMDIITAMRQSYGKVKVLLLRTHIENATKIIKEGKLFEAQVLSKREGRNSCLYWLSVPVKAQRNCLRFSLCWKSSTCIPRVGEESCCGYIVEATGFLKSLRRPGYAAKRI